MMTKNTLSGVCYGLAAGALWGLIFIAPSAVEPYTAIDLAIARYLTFGVVSLLLMMSHVRFRPIGISYAQLKTALWLGVVGYVLYYICVAFSVRLAGPAIAPLIIGALPLTLAVYGNFKEKNIDDRFSWSLLLLPLSVILIGLICIYVSSISQQGTLQTTHDLILGSICALAAHVLWFIYAVMNSNVMRGDNPPQPLGWTSLQGVGAMLGVVPLIVFAPVFDWSAIPDLGIWHIEGARFIFWAMIVGIIASWGGQHLWTLSSNLLPLNLSGQLIVSETIFGLAYGFLWFSRWPTKLELIGATMLISGVMIGVWLMSAKRKHTSI